MVGYEKEKKETVIKWFHILSLLLLPLGCMAAEPTDGNVAKRFNFGIRAAVNAPFTSNRALFIDWVEQDFAPDYESGIGASLALFGRMNFNRHYLQIEAGSSYFSTSAMLQTIWFDESVNEISEVSKRTVTIDIPLLYGYSFVKKPPYEFSFFGGPKFRYSFDFDNVCATSGGYDLIVSNGINPASACFIVGLAAKISRFTIDFRYELGITVDKKPGEYVLYGEDGSVVRSGTVYMKNGINLLSFSLGVIL